ncbi:hypothetical protein [Botrimarina hoheduenensis]|uniref:hypothetical protein n=1 Tax=Botrimarina hoheduenensis TaxID=2528000 RepID=UPI0011B54064|nr:hypothetical protein [Botrimarina hoheduenensis]
MPEPTRLVRDDSYEEMGASYQCVQVATLDRSLQENGVTDPAARRSICESFLFAMGELHDQGWLKPTSDSEKVYPLLCFTRRFLNTDTPINELGDVLAPSTFFAFHEYAHGNASLLYEGDPNANVETGVFDGET